MGAGKVVKLGLIRDGKEQEVSVTLKQADKQQAPPASFTRHLKAPPWPIPRRDANRLV